MKQDEAERLARIVKLSAGYELDGKVGDLCDHILSGDMRCEIENAAFEKAMQICDQEQDVYGIAIGIKERIRSFIQPATQKDGKK